MIDFLTDPASHGGAAVEVIETHVAVVALAGDRAYKLKRAVAYAFLDFTTIEARRKACEAEVRLNRRTAPDLYLGVEPITRRTDGKLAIGGDGTSVDWVVVMRRFDQADLFDRMADTGRLTVPLIRRLTDVIVDFHRAAAPRRDHGGRRAMTKIVTDNISILRTAGADLFDAARLDRLDRQWQQAVDRHGARLDRRRDAGLVRWCHGDLHLRNICLLDGVPRPFDGIEFNAEIACVDVLYDLAFLLMDLAHRNLVEFGNLVCNRYFGRTQDIGGVALLPVFMSLRAGVRAMVSALEVHTDSDNAAAHRADATAYLDLAERLLAPRPAALIAVGGLSGSGKSTLATALAPLIGGPPGALIWRSDVIRKTKFEVLPEQELPVEAYTRAHSIRVYRRMRALGKLALRAGHSTILDAVFTHAGERARVADIARRAGVPFVGLWLEAPAAVLRDRIENRLRDGADASDANLMVLERQLGYDDSDVAWRRITAGGSLAGIIAAARDALGDAGIDTAAATGKRDGQ